MDNILTSIIVNLIITALLKLNATPGPVPPGLTEALPGHSVRRHCARPMS